MEILLSHRGHLYIFERTRIYQRHGRVEYANDDGRGPRSFAIPIANTIFVLIGPGSSITTEAVRQLRSEGVCIGFCGSGGTPLFAGDDLITMTTPIDEYRNPEYLHRWISLWPDDEKRLKAAKTLMRLRIEQIERCWPRLADKKPWPAVPGDILDDFADQAARAKDVMALLGHEGSLTKKLYGVAAKAAGMEKFERIPKGDFEPSDPNKLLDHGNYFAYGLANVVLWALGIPASLAVVHGKTRRGGLCFDVADVIKDAVILPMAFNFAARTKREGLSETDFRSACINAFDEIKALQTLFDAVESALQSAEE